MTRKVSEFTNSGKTSITCTDVCHHKYLTVFDRLNKKKQIEIDFWIKNSIFSVCLLPLLKQFFLECLLCHTLQGTHAELIYQSCQQMSDAPSIIQWNICFSLQWGSPNIWYHYRLTLPPIISSSSSSGAKHNSSCLFHEILMSPLPFYRDEQIWKTFLCSALLQITCQTPKICVSVWTRYDKYIR